MNVPVIIVGNITVGGTGKTPFVITLVNALKKHGFHPGIISRGYGGKSKTWPQRVAEYSDPFLVGEEAVLMAKKTGVPIVVGPNRAESAKQLNMCNVIVSDDGLQHYALERDIEIAIIDGTRKFGNGFCLPAGPLREPQKRLDSVSYVVVNSDSDSEMRFLIDDMVSICNAKKPLDLSEHKNIIAIAAIGNPERFFSSLKKQLAGNIFVTKIFPDHYHFTKQDFDFVKPDEIIVMTEKDAVKCAAFADERFYQALGHAQLNETLLTSIIKHLHYQ